VVPGMLLWRYILYKYALISCLTLEVHKGRGREMYINWKMKIRTTVYIFQDYVLFSRLYSVVIVNSQQQIKTDFYM
jgi:hypothetical protein